MKSSQKLHALNLKDTKAAHTCNNYNKLKITESFALKVTNNTVNLKTETDNIDKTYDNLIYKASINIPYVNCKTTNNNINQLTVLVIK